MNEYKIRKIEIKSTLLIFLVILILGGLLNVIAVSSNGGKMPVYTKDSLEEGKKHFYFSDKNEVNEFYLTDIIRIKKAYFSIGDLTSWISAIFIIINIIKLVRVSTRKSLYS